MASRGGNHNCRLRGFLQDLTASDLVKAIEALDPTSRSELQLSFNRRPEIPITATALAREIHEKLGHHLAGDQLHSIARRVVGKGADAVNELVDEVRTSISDEPLDVRAQLESGFSRLTRRLSPRLVRLAVALAQERDVAAREEFDVLAEIAASAASPEHGPIPERARLRLVLGEPSVSPISPEEDEFSELCWLPSAPFSHVVDARVLLRSSGVRASTLDFVVLDELRRRTTYEKYDPVAAAEELIEIGGERQPGWFLLGFAVARSGPEAAPPPAPNVTAGRLLHLGRLAALIEAGSSQQVAECATRHRDTTEDLLDSPSGYFLAGAVLRPVLDTDPAWAASLVARHEHPFIGWRLFCSDVKRLATSLLGRKDVELPELLVSVVHERLVCWASGDPQPPRSARVTLQTEGAHLALLQAQCRRIRGDFVGAAAGLGRMDEGLLTWPLRPVAAIEAILVDARIGDIESFGLPFSKTEREVATRRLAGLEDRIDALVSADPTSYAGRLLASALALARGRDESAISHLRAMEAAAEGRNLRTVSECRAHQALCSLRLGEDTDRSFGLLDSALEDSRADVDFALEYASAVRKCRSSNADSLLARLVRKCRFDDRLLCFVCDRVSDGRPGELADLAEEWSSIDGLSLRGRFDLLAAAVVGAAGAGDRERLERLSFAAEDVVQVAADAELDLRWEAILRTVGPLRALVGPHRADLGRAELFRRCGDLEAARAIASRLHQRTLTGDGGDLAWEEVDLYLDLLGGGCTAQRESPSDVVGDRRVLVVGDSLTSVPTSSSLPTGHLTGIATRNAAELTSGTLEGRCAEADVVVIATLVRTVLGQRVRNAACKADRIWRTSPGQSAAALRFALDTIVSPVVVGRGRHD